MNNEIHPEAPEYFEGEIEELVAQLLEVFGDGDSRWHYEESSETLYIELESLKNKSGNVIEENAGPIFDACELEFEEIILLPLTD